MAGHRVLGICNGFQVLTECGLLPGVLMRNASLKFVCRDVDLRGSNAPTQYSPASSVPARSFAFLLPIMTAIISPTRTPTKRWKTTVRWSFRYCAPDGGNHRRRQPPTGHSPILPGILNAAGNVLGMMPHPERLADPLLGGLDGAPHVFRPRRGDCRVSATAQRPDDLMGLSEDEYGTILDIMGRTPNFTELSIFSVMWSEHCSYKSSKFWLKTLPTEGPQVIQGPRRKMPASLISAMGWPRSSRSKATTTPASSSPIRGAATGVGGIMRDVFTMGARPIANLNALRFGSPDHPKTRHLINGVVAGIGGYGNCIGVPTVGGEVNFDPGYNGNILVNAMTVGIASTDKIFYSAAAGLGLPVVYVGSKTGRDGIHGATMASAEFDDDSADKRPHGPGR